MTADLTALLAKVPLAPLGPGSPDPAVRPELDRLLPALRPGCQAGLWLAFGYWKQAHEVAQDLETPEGSFWHAILHRREPDPGNSKYWFRHVGNHSVFDQLRVQCPALGYIYTNASAFVDHCEMVRDTGTPAEEVARRVQLLEWRLLFDPCSLDAG